MQISFIVVLIANIFPLLQNNIKENISPLNDHSAYLYATCGNLEGYIFHLHILLFSHIKKHNLIFLQKNPGINELWTSDNFILKYRCSATWFTHCMSKENENGLSHQKVR